MPRKSLIDIACQLRGETDLAWRLDDGTRIEWVPKSQCEYDPDTGILTLPEWLAHEKGFI